MFLHTITAALGPILFGMIVGWVSGKTGFIKKEYAKAYAEFVVKIALPFALFLAAANAPSANILNFRYILALAIGLIGTYIVGWVSGRFFFRHNQNNSIIQALSVSFPDMAFCGPPVLLATIGSSGLIAMVMGNLIYTIFVIPLTLFLLGKTGGEKNQLKTIWKSFAQPLVILPLLGALISICGISLPNIVTISIDPLAKATGGVSIFFLSLLLSGIKIKVNTEILYNVFVKNIVQGAFILGGGILLGLHGGLLKSAFIIGILPTATSVPALAMANRANADVATETVLLSTLLSFVTIIGAIFMMTLM